MVDITSANITSGYIDGDGVFDLLMTSINSHLKLQYEEGRIKESDYATVYASSLQAVLAQSIQFLLGEQKADKEADLIQQQIEASKAQVIREDALTTSKLLLDASAISKTDAEKALLVARANTEVAQITDTIDGIAVVGLLGKQKNLYQKQADGFDRDAEQKVLKLFVDMYTVAKAADPDGITNFRWFTGSLENGYTDELEKAFDNAVTNAGLNQVLLDLDI